MLATQKYESRMIYQLNVKICERENLRIPFYDNITNFQI